MRYKYSVQNGKALKVAKIYEYNDHFINNAFISKNVMYILSRLEELGFTSYIVGGAVRDMIYGVIPKDFDIVTSATPRELKKIFSNVRIIGRRFRLVLALFENEEIEISTFRTSRACENTEEIYSLNPQEDFTRRDFTVNALYYDPFNKEVFDYCTGFEDLQNHILCSIQPEETSFKADPVRMVRAIKTCVKLDLVMKSEIKSQILKDASYINEVKKERLSEELKKIFNTGNFKKIFDELHNFTLLKYLIPEIDEVYNTPSIQKAICKTDEICNRYKVKKKNVPLCIALSFLLNPLYIYSGFSKMDTPRRLSSLISQISRILWSFNISQIERHIIADYALKNCPYPKIDVLPSDDDYFNGKSVDVADNKKEISSINTKNKNDDEKKTESHMKQNKTNIISPSEKKKRKKRSYKNTGNLKTKESLTKNGSATKDNNRKPLFEDNKRKEIIK